MARSHVTWLKLEKKMKKILLAAAFSLAATSLSAGSMATPEMEEPVVSASSSTGTPMLILLALLIAVGVSAK
tara:strand:+ start:1035 stop:1250 length:216 start_codon:yes stop_codon:yes gene_type:complete